MSALRGLTDVRCGHLTALPPKIPGAKAAGWDAPERASRSVKRAGATAARPALLLEFRGDRRATRCTRHVLYGGVAAQ